MKVAAEGVETAAHLEMSRKLGCDQAQGFYMSVPLSSEKLVEWLSEALKHAAAEALSANQ